MLRMSALCFLVFLASLPAQRGTTSTPQIRSVIQGSLTAPGGSPFHLKAVITEGREPSPYASVELFWLGPERYRRVIRAENFEEEKVVDGSHVYERTSQDYFPLALHTLITAMLDPQPIIAAVQDGDRVETVSNGAVSAAGVRCVPSPKGKLCFQSRDGVHEIVAASGHAVDFSHYEDFQGKKIARVLTNAPRLGEEPMILTITLLESLKNVPTQLLLPLSQPYRSHPLEITRVSEAGLRAHLVGSPEIIWPQTLDGATTGAASFFISVDRSGQVREVEQLYTVNERTNDSAVSQLKQWRFTPFLQGGQAVQTEGILRFEVNTRKFGPRDPLTDSQARALATHTVECQVKADSFPPGTRQTEWASVNSEGHIVEILIGEDGIHGPDGTGLACMQALQQWQFTPLMQDGKPLPFRAGIVFPIH